MQRYPEVEEALRQGKLCLSSTIELAKVLTPGNVSEVLPRFFGLSSRDAAAVAVSIRPVEHPPEREVVTSLRATAPAQLSAAPTAEEVLEAALDLLLAQRTKRKGIVEKPRKAPAARVNSETIPAAVKREVWTRAGGRCEWKLESGGTCDSTLRLEFDHILPRAMGGPSTVENVRLTCRCHNLLAARQAFGDEWMDRFARAPRSVGSNAARPRGSSVAPSHSEGAMSARAEDVTALDLPDPVSVQAT